MRHFFILIMVSMVFLSCKEDSKTYELTVRNPYDFEIAFAPSGPGAPTVGGSALIETDGERTFSANADGDALLMAFDADEYESGSSATVLGSQATFTPSEGNSYTWIAGSANVSESGGGSENLDCEDDPVASEYKERINGDNGGCQPCATCAALACAIYIGDQQLIDNYTAAVKQEEEYYETKTCPELY